MKYISSRLDSPLIPTLQSDRSDVSPVQKDLNCSRGSKKRVKIPQVSVSGLFCGKVKLYVQLQGLRKVT